MWSNTLGPISLYKKQKGELTIILLTAVTFALAINLISSSFPTLPGNQSFSLILGGILLVISLYGINKVLWTGGSKTIRIRGVAAFEKKGDEINKVKIHGYRFNDEFCGYLSGFLTENQAYKKLFVESIDAGVQRTSSFNPDSITFHSIMNSVLELVYLKRLQNHLNRYFVENEIDKKRITSLSRKDLDSHVLKNRVLDLITRDMEEREAFIDHTGNKPTEGIVVLAYGEGGAIYERFDLELPPKSSLRRNNKGFLEIENKLFKLTFRPRFEGFAAYVPRELLDKSRSHARYSLDIESRYSPKKEVVYERPRARDLRMA